MSSLHRLHLVSSSLPGKPKVEQQQQLSYYETDGTLNRGAGVVIERLKRQVFQMWYAKTTGEQEFVQLLPWPELTELVTVFNLTVDLRVAYRLKMTKSTIIKFDKVTLAKLHKTMISTPLCFLVAVGEVSVGHVRGVEKVKLRFYPLGFVDSGRMMNLRMIRARECEALPVMLRVEENNEDEGGKEQEEEEPSCVSKSLLTNFDDGDTTSLLEPTDIESAFYLYRLNRPEIGAESVDVVMLERWTQWRLYFHRKQVSSVLAWQSYLGKTEDRQTNDGVSMRILLVACSREERLQKWFVDKEMDLLRARKKKMGLVKWKKKISAEYGYEFANESASAQLQRIRTDMEQEVKELARFPDKKITDSLSETQKRLVSHLLRLEKQLVSYADMGTLDDATGNKRVGDNAAHELMVGHEHHRHRNQVPPELAEKFSLIFRDDLSEVEE